MAHWNVMIRGRNPAAGGIPPEVDRLARNFVVALQAAGCEVDSVTCHAAINSLRAGESDAEPPPATSNLPVSDH